MTKPNKLLQLIPVYRKRAPQTLVRYSVVFDIENSAYYVLRSDFYYPESSPTHDADDGLTHELLLALDELDVVWCNSIKEAIRQHETEFAI